MICQKCGFTLTDDAKFCGNCGAEVITEAVENVADTVEEVVPTEASSEPVEEVAPEEEIAEETTPIEEVVEDVAPTGPSQPVVKKKKAPKILIAVLAVIVALAGAFFLFKDTVMGKIMFLLPAETQLQAAYKNAAEDWGEESGKFVTDVSEIKVSSDGAVEGTMAITIGDDVKDLLVDEAGLDLGSLDKIYVDYKVATESTQMAYDIVLGLGKTDIMSINMVMDMEEGIMSVTIPEVSDTAIEINMESDLGMDMDEMTLATEQLESVEKLLPEILPEAEFVEELIPRYVAVILTTFDNVEREKDTLEVGDVSQKATSLTVTLDDRMMKNIGKAISDELKEDEELESYLKKTVKAVMEFSGEELGDDDWKEGYEELLDGVEEAFDSMAEEEVFQEGAKIVTWVNSNNEIIGLEVAEVATWISVKDGKQVAQHIVITEPGAKDELAKVLIEGEEDKDVFSGKINLYVEEEKIVTIDVDTFKSTDESFELAAGVTITDEMFEELTGANNPLGAVTLKAEINATKSSASLALKGIVGGNEWVRIEYSGKNLSDKQKITYPEGAISINSMDQWGETVDPSAIIDNLDEAGILDLLGVEDKELLKEGFADGFIQGFIGGMGSYDSYYDDDYSEDYDDYYEDGSYDVYYDDESYADEYYDVYS